MELSDESREKSAEKQTLLTSPWDSFGQETREIVGNSSKHFKTNLFEKGNFYT